MNKRIQELAEKTNAWFPDGYPSGEGGDAAWKNLVIFEKEDLQKFAELIVKECVQTLIDNTPERYTNESAEEDWDKGYDRAMKDCVHHIQEHFGVEE